MVRPIRDPSHPGPNGPGRAILFYESALEADGAGEGVNGRGHAARILDVGPSLVRAQALADPVPVARAIVGAKLKASAESVPAQGSTNGPGA